HPSGSGKSSDTPEYLPATASLPFVERAASEPVLAEDTTIVDSARRSESELEITFHQFYWRSRHLYSHDSEIQVFPDSVGRASASVLQKPNMLQWRTTKSPIVTTGIGISGI